MSDVDGSTAAEDGLLARAVSRRQVLRGGLIAGGAAFLAACSNNAATTAPSAAPTAAPATAAPTAAATAAPTAAATAAPTAAPTAAATAAPTAAATATPAPSESFTGVQLQNFTGGYMIPWLDAGTAAWKAATGGDAVSNNVDFAQKQIKQAGIIATQDPSWDMMYTTAAYGYIQKFAERLLLPVTTDANSYGQSLDDFFPNSKKQLSTGDVLRAIPLYDFPTVWGWNKKLFEKIGEDPENPPDNYPALFELAPKFQAAGIIPSVQPWLATQANLFALGYYVNIWNSTGLPFLNEDRTQIGFGGEEGRAIFDLIEQGFKTGFWDPKYMNLTNEHDAYKVFGDGNTATIIESESPILQGDMALFGASHGVRQHPGWKPGTSGSQGGPDGLGVSQYSQHVDAAWSWSRYNFSPEVEKAAATTVKDSTGALVLFPVARTSVVADPDVIKAQPLQPIYAMQNQFQTDRWSSPYDLAPVFNEAIAKMISGDYTAGQAHEAAVKGSQDLIIKYLSA